MKCSVYIAASVDGFIAREDGRIDWLERPEYSIEALTGLTYVDFIQDVNAIVMGRHSFEVVQSFNPWPYEGLQTIVLSSQKVHIPPALKGKIRMENMQPVDLVHQLEQEGLHHLYVDGGITIQRFLQAGLITEMTITRVPLLLGCGIPLFSAAGDERKLQLIEAFVSSNGFVQERYVVLN